MRILRILFALAAVLLAACAVWVTVTFRGALPFLLSVPEEACRQAEKTMEALCSMDYEAAEAMLYGMPDLGIEEAPESRVGGMIWDVYKNSLDYELVGEVYPTADGLSQKVKIISMELPTVTEDLGQRVQQILQQRVDAAQDVSEIYDADNGYREDLVSEVLEEAVRQALEENVRYTYEIVSLQLVYEEGQWWVKPDKALLNAVFGGIAG